MAHAPDAPDLLAPEGDPASGPVPAPDAPPDDAERTRARVFGDLVDNVMAGRTPAAVPADQRALLEVATAIRAATRPVALPAARTRPLIEAALAAALDRRAGARPGEPAGSSAPIIPITRARTRTRYLPWAVAATTSLVAAAAIALLVLRRPAAPAASPTTAALPSHQRSRPADPLIGVIGRDRAGDAAARLDVIYADRLDGFRERTLAAPRPARQPGASP